MMERRPLDEGARLMALVLVIMAEVAVTILSCVALMIAITPRVGGGYIPSWLVGMLIGAGAVNATLLCILFIGSWEEPR